MSKELEALNKIIKKYETGEYISYKEFEIIENALREHELMKQTRFVVADKKISDEDLEKLKNQRMIVGKLEECKIEPLFDEEILKKLKAFEIIKKKGNFLNLDHNETYDKYYIYDNEYYMHNEITKEEYHLLKEVLLWTRKH